MSLEDVTAPYGELLPRPQDLIKSGWHIAGWYTDYDLTEACDFETRPVGTNMVLCAAWEKN